MKVDDLEAIRLVMAAAFMHARLSNPQHPASREDLIEASLTDADELIKAAIPPTTYKRRGGGIGSGMNADLCRYCELPLGQHEAGTARCPS